MICVARGCTHDGSLPAKVNLRAHLRDGALVGKMNCPVMVAYILCFLGGHVDFLSKAQIG